MNWDQLEGKWKQMKGLYVSNGANLRTTISNRIAGKRDQLVGHIQERYGVAREEAEKQADEWWRTHGEMADTKAARSAR